MASTKTTITTRAMRPSVRPITASLQTTSGTWTRTTTCSSPSTMTMLTSTIAWCTPCVERARRAYSSTPGDVISHLIGSSPESFHFPLHVIHGALSLIQPLPSSFTFPSCPSPSTSSTTSCPLSSTTRSSWKEWGHLERLPLLHRLWAQRPDLRRAQQLISPRAKTWMTWHSARCSQRHTEDKSIPANQKVCQSVSQSSSSARFDGSGQPDKQNSSNAQIRTLLEEQRQTIIEEYREKVNHHELQAAHAEEERRLLQGQLWRQKLEFREAHQQSLTEMKELRKFQSPTFDTIARRKVIEDQNTILELSGRVQELQNEANCINDSKDFQDAESVRSGNSHVTSRPVSFPPHPTPEAMMRHSFVSPNHLHLHQLLILKNCINGIHHLRSGSIHLQWRKVKGQNKIKIWDASLDRQPKIQSSSAEETLQIIMGADQQRLQISDLHFDKFPTPATFACWKIKFKTEVCICSQFPTEAMQWIKEVALVDSVDESRSSSSIRGIPCRILKYLMRGSLQRWTKSSIILI